MPRSTDPTGAMPPEAADGSLTLTVSPARAASRLRLAFAVMAAECVALLVLWWRLGGVAAIGPMFIYLLLFAAAITLLAVVWILLPYVLDPPRLSIAAGGITMKQRGRTVTIGWHDLGAITLKTVSDGRYGVQTRTVLSGPGTRQISFLPVFDVAPSALATYIRDAQAAVLGSTPPPLIENQNFLLFSKSFQRGVILLMLAIAAVFLLLILLMARGYPVR
jgi:hypothetical protein